MNITIVKLTCRIQIFSTGIPTFLVGVSVPVINRTLKYSFALFRDASWLKFFNEESFMRHLITAVTFTASLALASAASATTINFNVGKGWNSAGHSYGASNEVTVTGATVDHAGKILTNDEFVASWFGTQGGLGICSASKTRKCTGGTSESSGRDQHTIDGKTKREMALLDFGLAQVEITSVTFAYWDRYDDFDFGVYASKLVGAAPTPFTVNFDSGSNISLRTFSFSAGQLVGSLFGFGANHSSDAFKLQSLTYNTVPPVSEVPLPAAGWLLLAGLGGMGAMKRRKKA
jgi:hypothetical protein